MPDFENITMYNISVIARSDKTFPKIKLEDLQNLIVDESDFLDEYIINLSFMGDGRIFGYTTINGIPKRLAVTLKNKDNYIVDSQFSRASDGWFEFKNLNRNLSYTILVRDPSGLFDDQYKYNVSPVL